MIETVKVDCIHFCKIDHEMHRDMSMRDNADRASEVFIDKGMPMDWDFSKIMKEIRRGKRNMRRKDYDVDDFLIGKSIERELKHEENY